MDDLTVSVSDTADQSWTLEIISTAPLARVPFEGERALVVHLLATGASLSVPAEALDACAREFVDDIETLSVADAFTAPRVRYRVVPTAAGRAALARTLGHRFDGALDVRAPLLEDAGDVDVHALGRYARFGSADRPEGALRSLARLLGVDTMVLDDVVRTIGEYESHARHLAPLLETRFEHAPHTTSLALGKIGAARSTAALLLALSAYWNDPARGMARPAALAALAWLGAEATPLAAETLADFAPTTDYERLAFPLARFRVLGDLDARDRWLAAIAHTPGYARPFAKSMVFDAPTALVPELAELAGPAFARAEIDTALERGIMHARRASD